MHVADFFSEERFLVNCTCGRLFLWRKISNKLYTYLALNCTCSWLLLEERLLINWTWSRLFLWRKVSDQRTCNCLKKSFLIKCTCSRLFLRRKVSNKLYLCRLYCHFLWDRWSHCCIFWNRVLLIYNMEGVRSIANFITAYEESQ